MESKSVNSSNVREASFSSKKQVATDNHSSGGWQTDKPCSLAFSYAVSVNNAVAVLLIVSATAS